VTSKYYNYNNVVIARNAVAAGFSPRKQSRPYNKNFSQLVCALILLPIVFCSIGDAREPQFTCDHITASRTSGIIEGDGNVRWYWESEPGRWLEGFADGIIVEQHRDTVTLSGNVQLFYWWEDGPARERFARIASPEVTILQTDAIAIADGPVDILMPLLESFSRQARFSYEKGDIMLTGNVQCRVWSE